MNLYIKNILSLFVFLSTIFIACKKEDDNISDDTNGSNNTEFIFGCMVDSACNYNASANQDNESCNYSCYGCTEKNAFNYDSEATINDGSCAYASQIMQNTWAVESNCDGVVLGNLIPNEVTIEGGQNEGDLIVDFGLFSLNGSVNNDGAITVDGEDPTGTISITGVGFLQSETQAQINITATVTLLSENCTLTLTLIE
jgi:hypothetical protein